MSEAKRTTLVTDSSKRHYLRTGINYSIYHKTLYSQNGEVSFSFSARLSMSNLIKPSQTWKDSGMGFWWYECPPGTVTGSSGITDDITPQTQASASAFFTHYAPGEGSYENLFSNFTAVVQYSGTKATPVGTCSYRGGYLDRTVANQITFGTTKQNTDSQYVVTGGTLYYKLKSASSYSSIRFTGNACTIPANTLQQSQYYDAYANLTCDDNASCTLTITDLNTHDAVGTAVAVSPVNTVIYGEGDFVWSYSNDTGSKQYAYDLQVSYNNGSSWTTVKNHIVTANTSVHVTGISAGNVLWRVRSYNQDNTASAWSNSLSIVSNAPPNPPVIGNITGNGRITVSWSVQDQVAYQVKIRLGGVDIYDSGIVYSSQRDHFVNQYLQNDDYEVGVRVFNAFGKSSDYAFVPFSQVTELSDLEAGASADPGGSGVIISASMPNAVLFYLIRDGVLVAQFTETYIDRYANGRIHYAVIGVDAEDRFARVGFDFEYRVQSNRLVMKDGEIFSVDLRWNDVPSMSQSTEAKYYSAEYLGASVPEHIFAKMRTKRIQVAFYDMGNAEAMLGRTVFYADVYGNGFWCVPVSVTRSDAWYGNETVLNLEMTNGGEEIEYAY